MSLKWDTVGHSSTWHSSASPRSVDDIEEHHGTVSARYKVLAERAVHDMEECTRRLVENEMQRESALHELDVMKKKSVAAQMEKFELQKSADAMKVDLANLRSANVTLYDEFEVMRQGLQRECIRSSELAEQLHERDIIMLKFQRENEALKDSLANAGTVLEQIAEMQKHIELLSIKNGVAESNRLRQIKRTIGKWFSSLLAKSFTSWKQNSKQSRVARNKVTQSLRKWLNKEKVQAFERWREVTLKTKEMKMKGRKVLFRMLNASLARALDTWRTSTLKSKKHKLTMKNVLRRMLQTALVMAMDRWREATEESKAMKSKAIK
eukprot:749941-Hanusia_phi.AAC.1